jgi:hypothetical protein
VTTSTRFLLAAVVATSSFAVGTTSMASETQPVLYEPLAAPARVVDTRSGSVTADGRYTSLGLQPAGSVLELQIAGRVGVPADTPMQSC